MRPADPNADFASLTKNEVEYRGAYNDAVKERIKAAATAKKARAWFDADNSRETLMDDVRARAYDQGGFWASMHDAFEQWGSLTPNQEAAVRRIIDQDAARKAARKAADASSTHVGAVGERRDFTLTLQGRFEYTSTYGMTYGHIFKDGNGNVIVYRGSNRLDGERGDTMTLKATIKSHEIREGINQTSISRPKAEA
jgi:hypothetical protein